MAILETRAFGLIAAMATVTIWAGFMLITRFAVQKRFHDRRALSVAAVARRHCHAAMDVEAGRHAPKDGLAPRGNADGRRQCCFPLCGL